MQDWLKKIGNYLFAYPRVKTSDAAEPTPQVEQKRKARRTLKKSTKTNTTS